MVSIQLCRHLRDGKANKIIFLQRGRDIEFRACIKTYKHIIPIITIGIKRSTLVHENVICTGDIEIFVIWVQFLDGEAISDSTSEGAGKKPIKDSFPYRFEGIRSR